MVLLLLCATSAFAQNSWLTRHSDHFDIYYRSDAGVIDRIANDAERAYARLSFDLDRHLAETVAVIVVRSPDDQASIVEAAGLSGAAERHLLVLPVTSGSDPSVILVHELTHRFEKELEQWADAPEWALEGLASHEADAWSPSDADSVRVAVKTNSIPGIGRAAEATRVWGHALFDFVATEYGLVGLRRYTAALGSNAFSEDSSREAFGVVTDDFDWRFKMFVRSRFGL